MRKRKSEHKRDIDTRLNRQPDIYPLIITTTCFVCMNRFPSPLGTLNRNIGGQIISIRICVSCQKNMSLYNGISTSSFTHITEDPKEEFEQNNSVLIDVLREDTNDSLQAMIVKAGLSFRSKANKEELISIIIDNEIVS